MACSTSRTPGSGSPPALIAAAAAVLLWAGAAPAQVSTSLSGTVFDATQAVVPEADVTLTQVNRNTAGTRRTNSVGRFLFTNLAPGPYRLSVSAPGFAPKVISGIVLTVDQKLDLDVTLELGATEQRVVVSADATALDTATPTVGQVVDNRQIANLPLNGRHSLSLISLAPNVRVGLGFDPDNFNGTAVFSINGGRTAGAEMVVDGSPSMAGLAGWYAPAYKPSLDSVQEFRVMTNTLPAEFGTTDGGAIRVVTKSGTNQAHGSAYDYLRNSRLDANSFFNNRNGIPLGSFKRNQFGGTLGGPVVLPKIYDGRNRTFFFVSYEGQRHSTAANVVRTVPTPAQRQGDFSEQRNAAGQLVLIYDPLTTAANASGTGYTRTPFAGNRIPASRVDPVAAKTIGYWPAPNNPGLSFTQANNLILGSANVYSSNQSDYRIDHRFSDRHSVYGRFSNHGNLTRPPTPFGNADTAYPRKAPSRHAVADYTWVRSNVTVVNLHFGYSLLSDAGLGADGVAGYTVKELGLPSSFVNSTPYTNLPQFNITDITAVGGGYTYSSPYSIYQYSGSVSHVRGRHTMKAGADIRRYHYYGYTSNQPPASFSFNRNYTQGPNPLQASSTAGVGFASFLLGAGSGSGSIRPQRESTGPILSGYVQDDWKATRRLTLSLGVRYDVFIPGTDPRDQMSWFDFTARSPLADRTGLDLRGGLRFAGQDASRRQFKTEWNNFAPRVGFAYTLGTRTTLRSGFAVLYPLSRTSTGYTQDGFTATTTWVSSVDGLTPVSYLRRAFDGGMIQPSGGAQGLMTLVGQSLAPADPGSLNSYNMQWNLTIQRELPGHSILEASYLGNRGIHLPIGEGYQINQLPPDLLSLGARLLDRVANPFYGIITSGILSGATTTRGQLLRPYPHFDGINMDRRTLADSIYHALGLRFQKRYQNGVVVDASYTNSKLIDNSSVTTSWAGASQAIQNFRDLRAERSLSTQDISQSFVLSFQAPIPVGRGQHWLRQPGRAVDLVAGGWQLNGIFRRQTGYPLGLTAPNSTGSLGGGQRPNSTGISAELTGDVHDRLNRYFDTSQFVQPAPYTFGNVSRTLADVRAPGASNIDLSLFKRFHLTEGWRLEFRAEAFNLANRVRFASPGTTLASPTFGVISAQSNSPRQIQLALRLDF